jgi:hypothetical protein
MDIFLIKTPDGHLVPAHESDREQLKAIKSMQPVRVVLRRVRNYEFHKKYFALLQYAYENWEPPVTFAPVIFVDKLDGAGLIQPEKNFDRFRKDIAILAGYYDSFIQLNGEVRLEAKSIAFHNMSEEDFEKLYQASIDVIVKHVLRNYDGDTLKAVLEQVEAFE